MSTIENNKIYLFINIIFYILLLRKSKKEVFLICTSPPSIIPVLILILKIKNFYKTQNIKKALLCQDIYPDFL